MDLTLLHKKLLPNWSAGTVSKSLSTTTALESIKNSWDKFERKAKMRILLSILNFDNKIKSDCVKAIKGLLECVKREKNEKVDKYAVHRNISWFIPIVKELYVIRTFIIDILTITYHY